MEEFYVEVVIDDTPKKDILVLLGDWNAKVGEDAYTNWKGTCGQYANTETNERGYRLLKFCADNDLVIM